MSIKAVAVIAGETVKGVIHFEQEVKIIFKIKVMHFFIIYYWN